jgi:PemK-like, MazF-like toxin of type II toxin-antitoxin system
MWAMMQKFRICAGAVKVWSAKLLMGISWWGYVSARVAPHQRIDPMSGRHNRAGSLGSARPDSFPYARFMASQWKTFQRFAENLVFNEAPKIIRQLQKPETVPRALQLGIKLGIDAGISVLTGATAPPRPAITAGRPITKASAPTAHRARTVAYAPDLDGQADPGEIVWTWVVYEEDPSQGKDRPVLVVGRDQSTLLGLMLSSQERHTADHDWIGIGSGSWDGEGRASWVRLDRVLDVPEEGIRREGAILDRQTFEVVAARLRAQYSWH